MATFSVIIPLYNKRDRVEQSLRSVFAQTFQPYEIVIVNDGSTDGSEQIVEQINHPLIRLIHQTNAGVSAARNKGIEEAKGDWIAFLDADDEWKPDFLDNMQMLAMTYPQCEVLASAYEMQDYSGARKSIILRKIPFKGEHGILSNYFEVASCSNPPICASAVVVKKDAIQSIGGFPVGIKSGEDLLTWARLALRFKIAYTRKSKAFFYKESSTPSKLPSRIPQTPDLVGSKLIELYKINRTIKGLKNYVSLWFRMRANCFIRNNYRIKALIESFKALAFAPFFYKNYSYLVFCILPKRILNLGMRK